MTNDKYLDIYGSPMKGIRKACTLTKVLKDTDGAKIAEIRYNYITNNLTSKLHRIADIKSKRFGEKGNEIYFFTLQPLTMKEIASSVRLVMNECGWY